MIYTLSNEPEDLYDKRRVRLTIDTNYEDALAILLLAKAYEDAKPDPILEALKAFG